MFYHVLDVWNLTFHMYDLITNGFLTSLIQSFYEAAIFKVHKLLGVRMLRGHVVLDFWPCEVFKNYIIYIIICIWTGSRRKLSRLVR